MIGPKEMIGILILLLLLFGPGRIVKLASEMGKGIKAFKDGLTVKEDNQNNEPDEKPRS